MKVAIVNHADEVVNVIEIEAGAKYDPPDGCTLVEGRDFPPAPTQGERIVPLPVIDGAAFLARVTDAEYLAITKSSNVQVQCWIELLRLRGEIDVSGETAVKAKTGLVALGLISQDRAEAIFAAAP